MDHSGDASYDIDQHYEDSNGAFHHFEIPNDVIRHIERLSENDTKVNESCPTSCADTNILSLKWVMVTHRMSTTTSCSVISSMILETLVIIMLISN